MQQLQTYTNGGNTLADVGVFVSFLFTSLSAMSVLGFACVFTFVADFDLLTDDSVEVTGCSPDDDDVFKLDFALSALRDLTRVRDSLLTVSAVESA